MSAKTTSPMAPRNVNIPSICPRRPAPSSLVPPASAFGDSLLWRQTVPVDALVQKRARHPALIGPFHKRFAFAECFYPVGSARIESLLALGCPAAITRIIWAVVIVSLKAVSRSWFRSHIGHEGVKIGHPSITNTNAATAVVGESPSCRITTSPQHINPDLIQWMLGIAVFCRISSAKLLAIIDGRAAAGSCIAATQIPGDRNDLLTTVTAALPADAAVVDFMGKFCDDRQPPKSLADQIKGIWCDFHLAIMPPRTATVKGR